MADVGGRAPRPVGIASSEVEWGLFNDRLLLSYKYFFGVARPK